MAVINTGLPGTLDIIRNVSGFANHYITYSSRIVPLHKWIAKIHIHFQIMQITITFIAQEIMSQNWHWSHPMGKICGYLKQKKTQKRSVKCVHTSCNTLHITCRVNNNHQCVTQFLSSSTYIWYMKAIYRDWCHMSVMSSKRQPDCLSNSLSMHTTNKTSMWEC